MKVFKDESYFKIYLSCIIIDGILTAGVIVLDVFSIISLIQTGFSLSVFILILALLLIVSFANVLAWNSMLGYLATPEVVLETKEDEVTLTPDRMKHSISVKKSEIKKVELVRPMVCRSGKRIVVFTESDAYHLEDVKDTEESFKSLEDWANNGK